MIFGMSGALRSCELVKVTTDDIEQHNNMLLVHVPDTKTKKPRSFTIAGHFYEILQRYANLRVAGMGSKRFFVNYKRGKCTSQVIGYHKIASMPRRVAEFLKLNDVEHYKGWFLYMYQHVT